MTGAWFLWRGGSWLEGAGLPAMGAQLCLGAGCAKVDAPGHPGHPPPLSDAVVNLCIEIREPNCTPFIVVNRYRTAYSPMGRDLIYQILNFFLLLQHGLSSAQLNRLPSKQITIDNTCFRARAQRRRTSMGSTVVPLTRPTLDEEIWGKIFIGH